MKRKIISCLLSAVMAMSSVSFVQPVLAQSNLVAFPGAEGGGMYTQGARAGDAIEVYHVTNLNDSGTGSFREAVSASNRIIVFDIAGTVMLKSDLVIKASNLTILGQTAPGEGVCIGGASVRFDGANEIILRYLRFRMGDISTSQEDGLGIRRGKNIIVDHCSVSWSIDECLSSYENMNTTVQNCIISESLRISNHDKGAHGYGGIWGGINASFHHNLITSHDSRNPRIGTSYTVHNYNDSEDTDNLIDIRNNVIYNWGNNSAYGGENGVRVNIVNNYYKPSDLTEIKHWRIFERYGGVNQLSTTLHVSGNVFEGADYITEDNWIAAVDDENATLTWTKCESISDGITTGGAFKANDEYIYDYPVTTTSANDAYNYVLENAGANIYRDSIDQRVINDVINGTYPTGSKGSTHFIDSQEDVGGWIPLYGLKVVDTDNDGMSDEWEVANGLDPNADDSTIISATGYTNIENYANSLATVTYDGYDIDTSQLKAEINFAKSLNQNEYTIEDWTKLTEAIAAAEAVYYSSAPTQAEIDAQYNELCSVVDSLEINYQDTLKVAIEKAKAIDVTGCTYESISALNIAIAEAESDLENANKDKYKADITAIEAAVAALEQSNKEKLLQIIDFVREKDISCLVASDRAKINSILDAAMSVYNNQTATNADVDGAMKSVYGIYSNGCYTRINQGRVVELNDFEDGEVFGNSTDNNGYSIYGNTDNLSYEIADGYKTNTTKVLKTKNSVTNTVDYLKQYNYNFSHYMISVDCAVQGISPKLIELLESDAEKQFYIKPGITCGTGNSKYDFESIYDSFLKPTQWVNCAIEVNQETLRTTYYVNNVPLYTTQTVPLSLQYYGFQFVPEGTGYYDNLKLVDLSETPKYVVGDCDNNGEITAVDCAQLLQRVLTSENLTALENLLGDEALRYIDMDCSGSLTSNDCSLILAKVLDSNYITPADEINSNTTEITTETTTETTTSSIIDYTNDCGVFSFDTATGAIKSFATDKSSIDLTIPAEINGISVVKIDASVFQNCPALKTLYIPGSVKVIDKYAFYGCINLEDVVIKNGVEQIGTEAFKSCDNLKRVVIEDGVTKIGSNAFFSCLNLENVQLPSTVNTLPSKCFGCCYVLQEIEIPEGIEIISSNCFLYCDGLTKITIPKSVTTITGKLGADNATIYCYEGSYAETYALENNIPYKLIQ